MTEATSAPAPLHLLVVEGRPLLEPSDEGPRALAGRDVRAACRLLAALFDVDPRTTIEARGPGELRSLLEAHGARTVRVVGDDGEEVLDLRGPAEGGASCPLVMVVEAGGRPDRDADAGRALLELRRERVRAGELSPLALDAWIAADQDLFVPCHGEQVARETWPRFERSRGASGEHRATFEFFTTIEGASRRCGAGGRVVAVGGRDALRWAFAAPFALDSVVVDPGLPTAFPIGRARVLSLLFPALLPFEGVESLPSFDVDDLTAHLPIDPDLSLVTGTLLRSWRTILGPSGPTSGDRLVGFCGQRSFVEALRDAAHPLENPVSPAEEPPFRHWLSLAAPHGSLVLDPNRPAPLELDLVRLCLLALWAERGGTLAGADLVDALARDAAAGLLDPVWTGRVAAQWPHFVVGESQDGESRETRPWIATADGALALFTSEERLARFVERERAVGRLRAPWRPRALTQTVGQDLFALARREYAGCALDPATADLVLTGPSLAAAEETVHELLWPRHLHARGRRRA